MVSCLLTFSCLYTFLKKPLTGFRGWNCSGENIYNKNIEFMRFSAVCLLFSSVPLRHFQCLYCSEFHIEPSFTQWSRSQREFLLLFLFLRFWQNQINQRLHRTRQNLHAMRLRQWWRAVASTGLHTEAYFQAHLHYPTYFNERARMAPSESIYGTGKIRGMKEGDRCVTFRKILWNMSSRWTSGSYNSIKRSK